MKNFIVFDKSTKTFYNNYWVDDQKIVIKIPLFGEIILNIEPMIEKFDLSNHISFFV